MKPYTRGKFRVMKEMIGKGRDFPVYRVQAGSYRIDENGVPLEWLTIASYDYLGNARRQVRNLHVASCSLTRELGDSLKSDLPEGTLHYLKTGKVRKFRKPKPSKP